MELVAALERVHDGQSVVTAAPARAGAALREASPASRGRRVRAGDPRYFEIVEFLEDEAALLDDNALMSWIELMADDLVYRAPVRITRDRDEGKGFAEHMFHLDETAATLRMKATRLALTPSAWAENPPSRTRRFVTNIRVHEAETAGEFHVTSSVLLVRNRYDDAHVDLLSAQRSDLIRRAEDGLQLARRTIYVDQSTLSMPNFAVFV